MERAPDFIGCAKHPSLKDGWVSHILWDVPPVRQANISYLAEIIPSLRKNFEEIFKRLGEG